MLVTMATGIFGVVIALLMVYLVRRDRLHVSHGLGWTTVILVFAFLGVAPSIFDTLASLLGVKYAPILGIMLAIGVLVIKALVADLESTRLKLSQQRLIQKVSLLEAELREISKAPSLDD